MAGLSDSTDEITLLASGDSPTELDRTGLGLETDTDDEATSTAFTEAGAIQIEADFKMTFGGNTRITADRIGLVAASRPSQLNAGESATDARMVFSDEGGFGRTTLAANTPFA